VYEQYWQLDGRPFEPSAQGQCYYPSECHQGALLKLRYAVENRRGAALVVGPAGTGKTMLCQLLSQHLAETFRPLAHLIFPQMKSGELLSYLADELGAPGGGGEHPARVDAVVRRLSGFLRENAAAGQHAVVIVDEAHLLYESKMLETLRLLLNFESQGQPALTLLLAAQPSLLPVLMRMPDLDGRLAVKVLLRPLTADETASYIQHRLSGTGARRDIFDLTALQAIHELTRGIPQQINRLCDLALLVGCAEELPLISAADIHAVCHELVSVSDN